MNIFPWLSFFYHSSLESPVHDLCPSAFMLRLTEPERHCYNILKLNILIECIFIKKEYSSFSKVKNKLFHRNSPLVLFSGDLS